MCDKGWLIMLDKFLEIMKSDYAYAAKFEKSTIEIQKSAGKLIYQYNNSNPDDEEQRNTILKELFQDENLNIMIVPPFHCDYGFNVHFEGFAFLNCNCMILDTSPVYIGDGALIAPGVCISSAGHGIHPDDRLQYNISKPIHIGKKVWIGANAVILPGVTIGDGSIIGAGSVVTKDIPSNVIAAGNPCKVLREINEDDRLNINEDILILDK